MALLKVLRTLMGIIGTLFIGITVTLFLVFPRVVNRLADLFGSMSVGDNFLNVDPIIGAVHLAIAVVIDIILFYFFIWWPTERLRASLDRQGLRIRKGEGQAYIDTESVRQQIFAAISQIREVKQADVKIVNDTGKALIQLNLVTDISINGPKKKSEISREVRKVVQDQLGVELSAPPTISFSLAPVAPPVPLITSNASSSNRPLEPVQPPPSREVPPVAVVEPPIVRPTVTAPIQPVQHIEPLPVEPVELPPPPAPVYTTPSEPEPAVRRPSWFSGSSVSDTPRTPTEEINSTEEADDTIDEPEPDDITDIEPDIEPDIESDVESDVEPAVESDVEPDDTDELASQA
ncbi:MAG: hypothetical protein ABI947_03890 [Chloroflexota bacterium]